METENTGAQADGRLSVESLTRRNAPFEGFSAPRPPAAVSPGVLASLAATAPWASFLNKLVWVLGILAAIGTIFALGRAFVGARWTREAGVELILSALGNVIRAVLLFALASKIGAYSRSLDSLALNQTLANLESAIDDQRLVWRFCGIVAIVHLALMIGTLLVAGVILLVKS